MGRLKVIGQQFSREKKDLGNAKDHTLQLAHLVTG
jgi:hypothetical protein